MILPPLVFLAWCFLPFAVGAGIEPSNLGSTTSLPFLIRIRTRNTHHCCTFICLMRCTNIGATTFGIMTLTIMMLSIAKLYAWSCYAVCHLCWLSLMLSVIYAECHLCWVSFMLSVIYAECHLCWVSFMLSFICAECHLCWVSFVLSVIHAECHLCWVSFMLMSFMLFFAKSFGLSVTSLYGIMLIVVAPKYRIVC